MIISISISSSSQITQFLGSHGFRSVHVVTRLENFVDAFVLSADDIVVIFVEVDHFAEIVLAFLYKLH